MDTIIFPGESKQNKYWLDEFAKNLGAIGFSYAHWDVSKSINFETELSRLDVIAKDYTIEQVIAKSAGTMLALYAIDKGILKPKKCVFMGIPLKWAKEKGIEKDLITLNKELGVYTIYIQQKDDPQGSHEEVSSLLDKKINMIEGNDHRYDYDDVSKYF